MSEKKPIKPPAPLPMPSKESGKRVGFEPKPPKHKPPGPPPPPPPTPKK